MSDPDEEFFQYKASEESERKSPSPPKSILKSSKDIHSYRPMPPKKINTPKKLVEKARELKRPGGLQLSFHAEAPKHTDVSIQNNSYLKLPSISGSIHEIRRQSS